MPQFKLIADKVWPGSKLLRTWELKGGVSAWVVALEIQGANGEVRRALYRRHGAADVAQNPNVAKDEFQLLEALRHQGLPVPRPFFYDLENESSIVMEFIDGETVFDPADLGDYLDKMASALHGIHDVQCDLSFLPNFESLYAQHLNNAAAPSRIVEALRASWPIPRTRTTLVHGDFWPGNVLWRDGEIAAVIDWEDAGIGDPLADVATTRQELLWAFGQEALTLFTQSYFARSSLDPATLPLWDLCAALRAEMSIGYWGLEPQKEDEVRRRTADFTDRALKALGR